MYIENNLALWLFCLFHSRCTSQRNFKILQITEQLLGTRHFLTLPFKSRSVFNIEKTILFLLVQKTVKGENVVPNNSEKLNIKHQLKLKHDMNKAFIFKQVSQNVVGSALFTILQHNCVQKKRKANRLWNSYNLMTQNPLYTK